MEKYTKIGRIIDVDSKRFTAMVSLLDNSGVLENVEWRSPAISTWKGAGFVSIPLINSYCCVELVGGSGLATATIVSFSPYAGGSPLYPTSSISPFGEGGRSSGANTGDQDFSSGRPRNLLPGDTLLMGTLGEAAGVLSGGVALLRASELSQIQAIAQEDIVRVISRNLQMFSDAGEIENLSREGHIFSHESVAFSVPEGRESKYRLRVAKGASAGFASSSGIDEQEEALYAIRLNEISEDSGEVPVADIVISKSGAIQLRSAKEVKSEVVQITSAGVTAIPRPPMFKEGETSSALLDTAKDHSVLITKIDNSDTLVKSLEVPEGVLEIPAAPGGTVYAGTTVELSAKVVEDVYDDKFNNFLRHRYHLTTSEPPGLQIDPSDTLIVEEESEVSLGEVETPVGDTLEATGSWKVTHRFIKDTPSTSTHKGEATTGQDLYELATATVLSVIHQTSDGEIHLQDNEKSSIDMQKGNISIKCKGTAHIDCDELKVTSKKTNWSNTDTVSWSMGKSSVLQGKVISRTFKEDKSKGLISHN